MKLHHYKIKMEWTGNLGSGTSNYRTYSRNHTIQGDHKQLIQGSSDPSFLGDNTRYNPEELFVSALSSCHMLWYLHLCSVNKIVVTSYVDRATGIMEELENGSGKFNEVTLNPAVIVADEAMVNKAIALHEEAHTYCFIANSINFPVTHNPNVMVGNSTTKN